MHNDEIVNPVPLNSHYYHILLPTKVIFHRCMFDCQFEGPAFDDSPCKSTLKLFWKNIII